MAMAALYRGPDERGELLLILRPFAHVFHYCAAARWENSPDDGFKIVQLQEFVRLAAQLAGNNWAT